MSKEEIYEKYNWLILRIVNRVERLEKEYRIVDIDYRNTLKLFLNDFRKDVINSNCEIRINTLLLYYNMLYSRCYYFLKNELITYNEYNIVKNLYYEIIDFIKLVFDNYNLKSM